MNVSHAESTTLHEAWGTSAFPIGVDSDSGSDTSAALCLESGFSGTYLTTLILHSSYIIHFRSCSLLLAAKYGPMESGIVRTSVMVLGREGVWHFKNLDFCIIR